MSNREDTYTYIENAKHAFRVCFAFCSQNASGVDDVDPCSIKLGGGVHSLHSVHWGSCGGHPAPIKNKDGVAYMCNVHWLYTVHWLCPPASHDLHLRSNKCTALSLVLWKADSASLLLVSAKITTQAPEKSKTDIVSHGS